MSILAFIVRAKAWLIAAALAVALISAFAAYRNGLIREGELRAENRQLDSTIKALEPKIARADSIHRADSAHIVAFVAHRDSIVADARQKVAAAKAFVAQRATAGGHGATLSASEIPIRATSQTLDDSGLTAQAAPKADATISLALNACQDAMAADDSLITMLRTALAHCDERTQLANADRDAWKSKALAGAAIAAPSHKTRYVIAGAAVGAAAVKYGPKVVRWFSHLK